MSGYPDNMTHQKRSTQPTAGNALSHLRGVVDEMQRLETAKVELMGVAQAQGASWDEIGSVLQVSRQSAWERYSDRVRAILNKTAATGQSEDELLASAASALAEVRRHRR